MLAATSRGRQNLWDATGLSRGGSRILLTCLGLVNKERETPPRKAVASLSPAVLAGSSQHENSTGQAGGISNVFTRSLKQGVNERGSIFKVTHYLRYRLSFNGKLE